MEKDDFIIRNAILHILDSKVGLPVLSDTLLELGPDLNDFLREHIYRIVSGDDVKSCNFNQEESIIYGFLKNFQEDKLITISQEICSHLYTLMNENIDIPSGDIFIVTYQINSILHLAILKMNYKETYVHMTRTHETYGKYNDIVKQTATLPSKNSRLAEAAFINLTDYSIQLLEKKYEINGAKTNYLSQIFLNCHTNMSSKAKLNIVTKAVEQVNKKYFEEDFTKKMDAKSIIQNEIAEQGSINVESISEKIYGSLPEIKEKFKEKLEKYNLQEDYVKPQNRQTVKKLEKQFLLTDSGIEINIPMEEYNTKQNIEFITNSDGTISVLIKNINHITSK